MLSLSHTHTHTQRCCSYVAGHKHAHTHPAKLYFLITPLSVTCIQYMISYDMHTHTQTPPHTHTDTHTRTHTHTHQPLHSCNLWWCQTNMPCDYLCFTFAVIHPFNTHTYTHSFCERATVNSCPPPPTN